MIEIKIGYMQRERRKNVSPPDISTFPTILTVTFTNAFYLARKFDAIVLNVDRIVSRIQ